MAICQMSILMAIVLVLLGLAYDLRGNISRLLKQYGMWYGDGAGNTIEENTNIFSVI